MEKIYLFCKKNYNKILFVVILFVTIFVRTYKVHELPYGLHVDEAGMAYDANSIVNYGVDRYLYKYPVHFINFSLGQSVMYGYLTSFFINLFGFNIITIRLTAILLGIISVILCYFIGKKCHSEKFALTFMALAAICPWAIMSSRFGLDCNLFAPMSIVSIFFLSRSEKTWHYFISGIFIGLTLYTYAVSYLVLPLFLVLLIIYLIRIKKISFKKIIIMGIPVFIIALPLMLMIAINKDIIPEIHSFITVPKLGYFRDDMIKFENIKNSFKYIKNIFTHDGLLYNATSEFGSLYYMSIPLVIIGFVISMKELIINFKNKKYDNTLFLLFLFNATIICMLIVEEPNINKANSIYFPSIYLISIALRFIYRESKKIFNLFALTYVVFFTAFIIFYFNTYSVKYPVLSFFEPDIIETIRYTCDKYKDEEISMNKCYIYTLLAEEITPYEYNKMLKESTKNNSFGRFYFDNHEINREMVYILNREDGMVYELIDEGFEYEEYKNYYILKYND